VKEGTALLEKILSCTVNLCTCIVFILGKVLFLPHCEKENLAKTGPNKRRSGPIIRNNFQCVTLKCFCTLNIGPIKRLPLITGGPINRNPLYIVLLCGRCVIKTFAQSAKHNITLYTHECGFI
jgi:hypothetical protein